MKTITISTDFFNNDVIQAIGAEYGPLAELLTIRLILDIHRNGYYLAWGHLTKQRLTRAVPGLSEAQVDLIVRRLAEYGVFDRRMMVNQSVLTSAEIQNRYFKGHSKGDTKPPYLLVELAAPKPKKPRTSVKTAPPAEASANDRSGSPATGKSADTCASDNYASSGVPRSGAPRRSDNPYTG